MRRSIVGMWLSCMMAVSTVVCGGAETQSVSSGDVTQGAELGQNAPVVDDTKTISLFGLLEPGRDSSREQGVEEVLKTFIEKAGYGLTTEIIGWERVEPKFLVGVESGDSPDVMFVRIQFLSVETNADILMPLDDFIERGLDEATREDFLLWDEIGTYNERKCALPMSIILYGVYVRDDLMKEVGITKDPTIWDEFLIAAEKMNSSAASGFMFWGLAAQPVAVDYLQPMIESFGGKLLDDGGKAVFDPPEAMKAFYLIKPIVFECKVIPSNVVSLKYDGTSDMFTVGRAAMYWDGSYRASKYLGGIGEEYLRSMPLPSEIGEVPGPFYTSYWALGIPKNSKNPGLAWEYIKNLVETSSQSIYAKVPGEVPVRRSAMEDDYFKTDPDGQRIRWFVDYVGADGTAGVAFVGFSKPSEVLSMAVQEIITDSNSDVETIVIKARVDYNAEK